MVAQLAKRKIMETQTQAARVIAIFGSRGEVVRLTRFTYHQIRRWDEAGFIPTEHFQAFVDDAAAAGIEIPLYAFTDHLTRGQVVSKKSAA